MSDKTIAVADDDGEKRFYEVLQGLDEPLVPVDDLFDSREGSHARRNSAGDIGTLLMMTEKDAKHLWLLVRHMVHHDCSGAKESLEAFCVSVAMKLEEALGTDTLIEALKEDGWPAP
jgi:hypothetical protein